MSNEYKLDRAALDTITDAETVFGCTRLLPRYDSLPDDFKWGNVYTRCVSNMFFGLPTPAVDIKFRAGFDDADAQEAVRRAVRAHLRSCQPKHEHKIAGVAYMISKVCEIKPVIKGDTE